ncbi:hypothetical protein Vretimale_6552 [Volvox reticuliferus]|uniref:Uncharacterized protein n=1 Tax=Volvox reticuliferus TaxID=1737510 RepID=A0A8J4C949_9CHLO|nr:hypothetical protein Vretifemale_7387 [Volvox reticuliferus]GIM01765.1 hypothetical protein Vretimale_6552 [Volvox reticuliferus]
MLAVLYWCATAESGLAPAAALSIEVAPHGVMGEGFAPAGIAAVAAVVATVGTSWRQRTPQLPPATPRRTFVAAITELTTEVHPRSSSDRRALPAIELVAGCFPVPAAPVATVSLIVVAAASAVYAAEPALPEDAGLREYGHAGHTQRVARTQLEKRMHSQAVRLLQT